VGAFRTITADSLQRHLYQGDAERFKKNLSSLTDQRLVIVQPDSKSRGRYISLTREGKGVTERHLRSNSNQSVYSGIVKKRELRHDAAIYDVYQKEAQKISKSGGTPKRVVLDFELKKNVNRQLAKIQNLPPTERERQRKEIADAHELTIVKGKIQIPDVRVEYESRDQEQCKVDLECVTGHYKARQIAAKAAAGFKLYNQDYRGRSAERGQDLVGEVISL
jgi:DNA-binding MarR family transcriptional regulator